MTGSLPRPIRAVLFDLDDTLYPEHDFVDGGFRAVGAFLGPRLGRTVDEIATRLWTLHGRDGRGRLFDALLAEHGIEDPDLVLACLLAYRTHRPRLEPFPGVIEAIEELVATGIRLGIVSDGQSMVQRGKLEGLGLLASRFEAVVLTDELGPGHRKPSAVPFRVACRILDVPPAATAYVGNDPRKDFSGAREAGLLTIRMGRLPDEGGPVAVPTGPEDAADITIDTFPLLASLVTGTAGQPLTR